MEEIKSCGWKNIFFWLFGGCQKFSFAERSLIFKLYLFIYLFSGGPVCLSYWVVWPHLRPPAALPTVLLPQRWLSRNGTLLLQCLLFVSLFSAWRCVYECSFFNPEYEYLVVENVNSLFVLINPILMKISDFVFSISEKYTCFTVWCKEPADISEKDQIQWHASGGLIYWESSERVLTTATSDRLWGSVHSKQTRQ